MNRSFMVLVLLIMTGCAAQMVNPFTGIVTAPKDSYGYSEEDPIRLKYSNDIQQNIGYCYAFMERLRTEDSQTLNIVFRASISDPKNKISEDKILGVFPKRFDRGLAAGILDRYTLITQATQDTVILYFDIYHKEPVFIPIGLKYVESASGE